MKALSKAWSATKLRENSASGLERPVITLPTPDSHLFEGDELVLFIWPPCQQSYQVEIRQSNKKESVSLKENIFRKKSLKAGETCCVRSRYCSAESSAWSLWSREIEISFHSPVHTGKVQRMREFQHRIAMMSSRDINGVATITDPRALPPSFPENARATWFRTPCYEGATMLINESAEYYQDPLNYLIDNIVRLKDKGATFRNWNDLIVNSRPQSKFEVIIQFDLDAGVHSLERILPRLLPLNVCANIMIHRKCFDWYAYKIEELDIALLREAEKEGWTIGYHNNSISNVHFQSNTCGYDADILQQSTNEFRSDLQYLRELFDIQTFTHHGGNVFNKKTPVPDGTDVVCVDKAFNPDLWKTIKSAFSDGGFFVRPCTLSQKVDGLEAGRHFFRFHPVKYGNYSPPYDILPLDINDLKSLDLETDKVQEEYILSGQQKQLRWLDIRDKHRLATRLNYDCPQKPISERFRPFGELESLILKHYAHRSATFRRLYPWIGGDPRVFWWRLLDAFVPPTGEILNVGAMPPGRKDETTDFVSKDVAVLEMDIDPTRKPDLLCDITQAGSELNDRFDGVLFFGLPCVHSPSLAVEASLRLTKPGGLAVFGFASATHTARGGLWNPKKFPVYQKHLEPLKDMDSGRLWSYDEPAVEDLFGKMPNTLIETFAHYWFVICYK